MKYALPRCMRSIGCAWTARAAKLSLFGPSFIRSTGERITGMEEELRGSMMIDYGVLNSRAVLLLLLNQRIRWK